MTIGEAVQWAEEHLFDRNSVVLECQVWQEALGRARGESFSVSELKEFTQRRGYIRDEARPGEVTLREVLLRECEIVQTAKEASAIAGRWLSTRVPRIPSSTMNSALPLKRCSARQIRYRSFVAGPEQGKLLSFTSWSSRFTSLAARSSFSPHNVSKSWIWRRLDSRQQQR